MNCFGAAFDEKDAPTAAVRKIKPLYPESVYLKFCRDVCGAEFPLRFWHDENIREVEELLARYPDETAADVYRAMLNGAGNKLRARIRAISMMAARG